MDIQALNERITELEKQVSELKKQHERDQEIIEHQRELLSLRTRAIFARKSEKAAQGEQLSLFDEVELEEAQKELEDRIEVLKEEQKPGRKADEAKARKAKARNLVNCDSLPIEEEIVKAENVPEGAKLIGYVEETKLAYRPGQYTRIRKRYERWKYVAPDGTTKFVCAGKKDGDTAFSGSQFDPTVISHAVYEKVVKGMPLYRQEQDLARKGIGLSRQSVSAAIFRGYEAVRPVVELIHGYVREADNCRADETRLFIIENNGDKARLADPKKTQMSYVWLYMTAEGYHPAFAYVVGPSRKYENPARFFGSGLNHRFLQTDDYGAYDRLEKTDRIPCWVHTRRYWYNAMMDSGREDYSTTSGQMVNFIDLIFAAESKIQDTLAPHKGEQHFHELVRLQREIVMRPLFDAFYRKVHDIDGKVNPKSSMGRAVGYTLGHERLAYNFFLDGRLTLSNNEAEREGIKPLVIGRKAWLFSNTEKGAEVTCGMYTIMETALHNGLNPEDYLLYLYRRLPYAERKDFDYKSCLPWSESLPEWVRIPEIKR